MLAPSDVRSIDALIADDPGALEDAELRANLVAFAAARARLDAAEAATIAEFDQRCVFVLDGQTNTKSWLAHHTHLSREIAGARVKRAKHLRHMPLMAKALVAGVVTEGHAVAMGRCLAPRLAMAFERDEAVLVEAAVALEVDDFVKVITEWISKCDEDGVEPAAPELSELRASVTLNGRVKTDGDFEAEDGAELLAELEAIYEELWREDQAADKDDPLRNRSRAQRLAAAEVEMARRSSSVRRTDPNSEDASARPRGVQILAVVQYEELLEKYGTGELESGLTLQETVLERWRCDSSWGRILMEGESAVLDAGRTTYQPNPAQRRALAARDKGCMVAGCGRKARWCQAHHVVPFPAGPTSMENLVLLCHRHHKFVHH
jgi:Domain of unknown function (DUF222)